VDKYAIVIHEDPEGGFWAEVPALPGCYSQGETVDELMGNIREAISGVLDVMKGTAPSLSQTFRFWTLCFEADYRARDLPLAGGERLAV
jgi:predicted RNase H-like HicB family nuclease